MADSGDQEQGTRTRLMDASLRPPGDYTMGCFPLLDFPLASGASRRCSGAHAKPQFNPSGRWRQRPWAIVLLILLAVAFGAQVVLAGLTFLTVSVGTLLFSWVALLMMSLGRRAPAEPPA